MATRQPKSKVAAPAETVPTDTATAAEEAQTVTTTDAAPEAATENVPTEAPAEVEEVIDLTAFEAAVTIALENSSEDGDIIEGDQTAVTEAYRALSAKGKAQARTMVNVSMKTSMKEGRFQEARGFMNLHDALTTAAPASKRVPKVPVNPTDDFVDQLSAVRLAFNFGTGNLPEGLDADWTNRVQTKIESLDADAKSYLAWLKGGSQGDAPEVDEIVVRAAKLGTIRVGKRVSAGNGAPVRTYTGPARSVGKHIAEAFADKPVGTFMKVAEITGFKSTEYGDDAPSPGAVSSSLKSTKFSVAGIQPGTDDKGKVGATKVA
jgi:hypothetical protein